MNIEYLKQRRKDCKYSQQELADILNVSKSVICQWEKGKINPKVSVLKKLCKLLDMDANKLLNL